MAIPQVVLMLVAAGWAPRRLTSVRGAIRLRDVSSRYPGAERPALDRVSLDVEPGQLVALVGASGAGKTTLTGLVPRFFDPQSGTVRINGRDLRDVTLDSLGAHIGIVFEDTFLFHAVGSLPEGYDTLVGERGHRLSGGEKQRVAIANRRCVVMC